MEDVIHRFIGLKIWLCAACVCAGMTPLGADMLYAAGNEKADTAPIRGDGKGQMPGGKQLAKPKSKPTSNEPSRHRFNRGRHSPEQRSISSDIRKRMIDCPDTAGYAGAKCTEILREYQ